MNTPNNDMVIQFAVTFDDLPPHATKHWPLHSDNPADALAEYASDAITYGLPGPHTVTFWRRTSIITTFPWQALATP